MFKTPKKRPKMANFENLNLVKGSKTYSRWNLKKNNALDMDNLKKFEDRQLSTIVFFLTFWPQLPWSVVSLFIRGYSYYIKIWLFILSIRLNYFFGDIFIVKKITGSLKPLKRLKNGQFWEFGNFLGSQTNF